MTHWYDSFICDICHNSLRCMWHTTDIQHTAMHIDIQRIWRSHGTCVAYEGVMAHVLHMKESWHMLYWHTTHCHAYWRTTHCHAYDIQLIHMWRDSFICDTCKGGATRVVRPRAMSPCSPQPPLLRAAIVLRYVVSPCSPVWHDSSHICVIWLVWVCHGHWGVVDGVWRVHNTVLQCVAVCCSVLQCVAVCCCAVNYVAECCSVLQCVAVCFHVLQSIAVCCSVF